MLSAITSARQNTLLILGVDQSGAPVIGQYATFSVQNELANYMVTVGAVSQGSECVSTPTTHARRCSR
jgi:hypothetical protein